MSAAAAIAESEEHNQAALAALRNEIELREQVAMRDRRIIALEKQCALLAAEIDRLHAEWKTAEVGLNLFRQLVECFWEQCEQWAAAAAAEQRDASAKTS